jgi:hypothetical protein
VKKEAKEGAVGTHMLNNALMKFFPAFLPCLRVPRLFLNVTLDTCSTRRSKNASLSQCRTVKLLYTGPAHELRRREALRKVTFKEAGGSDQIIVLRQQREKKQHVLAFSDGLQLLIGAQSIEQVVLLVVIRSEDDEE